MLQHFPSGTSGRNIVHTAQNIKQDKFQAYDWGIRFSASSSSFTSQFYTSKLAEKGILTIMKNFKLDD